MIYLMLEFSLLFIASFMTLLLFVLDAVDVAMTEAAVGAGITTVLLLATVYLVGNKEIKPLHKPFLPIFVSLIIVSTLILEPHIFLK